MKEVCNKNENNFTYPLCKESLNYQKNVLLESILNKMNFVWKKYQTSINDINDYREYKKNLKIFINVKYVN